MATALALFVSRPLNDALRVRHSGAGAKRRAVLLVLLACGMLASPGCGWDGNFTLFGYTTTPNYDRAIRTVHVPIFQNTTFRRDLEFRLTQAVIREIESKTVYKVVSNPHHADTELNGRIVNRTKSIVNTNQIGEIREGETTVVVELVWRDLRPGHVGEILSRTAPLTSDVPLDLGGVPMPPPPVLVSTQASFIPELGGSLHAAEKQALDRLAVQIVSMMEKSW